MKNIQLIEGQLSVKHAKFALLAGRFNAFIVESLVSGAIDMLQRSGIKGDDITLVRVPGAIEMPVTAEKLAASHQYDAIIALGAVIRGSTPHFDVVVSECSKGLGQVALKHTLPVIFGVLTTDNIEQAIERAGTKAGNKGAEAAQTAIEMVSLLNEIS